MIQTHQPIRKSSTNRKRQSRTASVLRQQELVPRPGGAGGEYLPAEPALPIADRFAYSVAETALITGLSRDLLYNQMRLGKLRYLKVGRRRVITRRDLDVFLATTE